MNIGLQTCIRGAVPECRILRNLQREVESDAAHLFHHRSLLRSSLPRELYVSSRKQIDDWCKTATAGPDSVAELKHHLYCEIDTRCIDTFWNRLREAGLQLSICGLVCIVVADARIDRLSQSDKSRMCILPTGFQSLKVGSRRRFHRR